MLLAVLLTVLLTPVLVLPATLLAVVMAMLVLRMPVRMTAVLMLLLRPAIGAGLRRVRITVEPVRAILAVVELILRAAIEIVCVLRVGCAAAISGLAAALTAEWRPVRIVRIELSSAAPPPATSTSASASAAAITGLAFLLGVDLARRPAA